MAKRALIIRSGYNPLAGFANSATCITQALGGRGFKIIPCEGRDATRAGILRAYDDLIRGADSTDAIVIYYVGHGGLVTNPSYAPNGDLPPYVQHICPTDFAQTTDDDFRGISAPELSLQLASLTRKTQNVTVVLECCFAGQMSRGVEPPGVQQVPPTLTRAGLVSHFQLLRRCYPDLAQLALTGNTHAVRVAAAGQIGSAYHVSLPPARDLQAIGLELPSGGWIGAMTLGLVQILAEIGETRVTWRSIGEALRARLYVQRPEIEGPVNRVPFSLAMADAAPFGVRADSGTGAIVDAGRLFGVSVGDVYGVMPAGSSQLDPALMIAEITIDEATAVSSLAHRIDWHPGRTVLPANAVAIARSLAFEHYPVTVVADDGRLPAIGAALRGSTRIRMATPRDRDPLAELRVHGETLELHDQIGPLFPPAPYPGSLPEAIQDLENLATERRLRVMSDEQGVSRNNVSVDLLVVAASGDYRPLADHGAALGLGDRLAVRLVNRTDAALFAHVFNIGLRRRIAMLSEPGGIHLVPDTPAYCGAASSGQLIGFELRWAGGLPTDQPRTDTVMVVVTPEPADLGALASREHLARGGAPVSPLQAMLGQIAHGGSRGRGDEPAQPPGAFAMYWRDYQLYPLAGSLDYGTSQVDASPVSSPLPRNAAAFMQVRLDALTVAPDTRVDILVCARSSSTPYCATTVVRSPPGTLVIWSGELRGVADVYVWSSSQPAANSQLHARRTLADLLASRPPAEVAAMLRTLNDDALSPLAAGAGMQLAALARSSLCSRSPGVATVFHGSFGADARRATCSTAMVSFTIAIDRGD